MAAKLVLPGLGGAYTSETFSAVSVDSVGADTFDLSRCAQFAVQIQSTGSGGDGFQLQQTFNGGTSWDNFGSRMTATTLYGEADGPFGVMRFGAVSISLGSSIATISGRGHFLA